MNKISKLVILLLIIFVASNFVEARAGALINCETAEVCVYPANDPNVPDAIEIQNAINIAFLEGKNLCLEPNRIYEVDRRVIGYSISIEGNNATIKIKDGVSNGFWILQYSDGYHLSYNIPYENSDFFIRNLNIDGNRDNIDISDNFKASYMFAFINSNRVLMENCHFMNVANYAVYIQDGSNIAIESSSFIDVGPCEHPLNCYCITGEQCPGVGCGPLSDSWDAISMTSYNHIENVRVSDCHFENIGLRTYEDECLMDADAVSTIALAPIGGETGTMEGIILTGNYFENVARRCLKLQSGHLIQVTDNVAVNVNGLVNNVMATEDHIIKKQVIHNNTVSDAELFFSTAGIQFTTKEISIMGNTFNKGKRAFIYGGSQSSISNALIANNICDLDSDDWDSGPYVWVGEGDSNFIVNNSFEYNTNEDFFSILILNPERFRIEGNEFNLQNEGNVDNAVILLANQDSGPGFNIIRHNSFNTNHGGDTDQLILTNLELLNMPIDSTNILLID